MLSKRSHEPELIDLGSSYYTVAEYRDCLSQLEKIGCFLGGDRATFKALSKLKFIPESLLDVGCGSGQFTIRLAEHYPMAKIEGIDISHDAIEIARENLKKVQKPLSNVHFFSSYLDEIPRQFDVVTATLVTHHLSDQELISFLRQACQKAKRAVILNDLHRHFLASLSFNLVAPILFPNRLIQHDGSLSIRRAFTRQDWWRYLEAAGINKNACSVTWHWAFRWIVMIDITRKPFE